MKTYNPKYIMTIKNRLGNEIKCDIYDLLNALDLSPEMQHAFKKVCFSGKRGHKDAITDLNDIIASVECEKQRIDSNVDSDKKPYRPITIITNNNISCGCELKSKRLQADLLEFHRAKNTDKIEPEYLISELEKIEVNKSFNIETNRMLLNIDKTVKSGVRFRKKLDLEVGISSLSKGYLVINRVIEIVKRMNDEIKACHILNINSIFFNDHEEFKNAVNSANERYLALDRELDQIIDKQNAAKKR